MSGNLILGIILIIFVLISAFIETKQGIYIKTRKGSKKITLLLSLKSYMQYIIYGIALISIYFIYPNSSVIVKKIFRAVTGVIIFIISCNMCRPIVISFILNDFSESGKEWKEYCASRNIFKKILIKIFKINFDGFKVLKTKN
jgi:hypothetical protein